MCNVLLPVCDAEHKHTPCPEGAEDKDKCTEGLPAEDGDRDARGEGEGQMSSDYYLLRSHDRID